VSPKKGLRQKFWPKLSAQIISDLSQKFGGDPITQSTMAMG